MSRSAGYPFIQATREGLLLSLYIQPSARKDELCGIRAGSLKIRLNAPPVDGKANKRLVEYLARVFGIRRSSVEIVGGHASRRKQVRLKGIEEERVETIVSTLLGRSLQVLINSHRRP